MDQDELERLEHVVDRGRAAFVEVGQALAAIRDRRGYRLAGYATFEAYLQERWGWSRQRGYQLIHASDVVADLAADEMSTPVDIPTEGHARALVPLAPAERRSLLEQVGDLSRYSTRELYQAARQVKSEIRARPAVSRSREQNPGVSLRETEVMRDPDIRIEQGLAEHLPWADGEINLGITSPPYCLGEGVAYADGGDYDDYTLYGDQLVPAWCREFFRVTDPAGGRWCVNVPMDVAGHRRRDPKGRPLEPQPMYADWLQALLAAGFSYRTTILWHDDQAGAGTDRGTSNPSAPHVVAPVEAIIVVHRGAWKRVVETERRHDLDHEDWLQLCGPRVCGGFRVSTTRTTRHLSRRSYRVVSSISTPGMRMWLAIPSSDEAPRRLLLRGWAGMSVRWIAQDRTLR